jgi:hypothetical protein
MNQMGELINKDERFGDPKAKANEPSRASPKKKVGGIDGSMWLRGSNGR